jgi:5'-methylthioinosine phosphorylase
MMRLGLIGGTGLDRWGKALSSSLPETSWGAPSGPLQLFRHGQLELVFLPRHGPEHRIPPHRVNYRANIDALSGAAVDAVIAVNAVGGITDGFGPGVLAVPDQLVDYSWGRAHSFSDGDDTPLQHVEFAEPFDGELRHRLLAAGTAAGVAPRDGGCIAVTQGPRLETAAEIARYARDGCDLVGMTSMPEAALAREAGLPYASVAVVANWAAGVSGEPITMAAIEETLAQAMHGVRALITELSSQ